MGARETWRPDATFISVSGSYHYPRKDSEKAQSKELEEAAPRVKIRTPGMSESFLRERCLVLEFG